MEITSINLIRFNKPVDYGEYAVYNLTLDKQLCVPHVKLKNGKGGIFITFPYSKKTQTPPYSYTDAVFPITPEFRQYLTNKIVEQYNKDLERYKKGEIKAYIKPERSVDLE